jgi:hypothetical protein
MCRHLMLAGAQQCCAAECNTTACAEQLTSAACEVVHEDVCRIQVIFTLLLGRLRRSGRQQRLHKDGSKLQQHDGLYCPHAIACQPLLPAQPRAAAAALSCFQLLALWLLRLLLVVGLYGVYACCISLLLPLHAAARLVLQKGTRSTRNRPLK